MKKMYQVQNAGGASIKVIASDPEHALNIAVDDMGFRPRRVTECKPGDEDVKSPQEGTSGASHDRLTD